MNTITPFTLVSAERDWMNDHERQSASGALAANFAVRGIEAQAVKGIYNGSPENSFLVPGPEGSVEWDAVLDMAQLFHQESVLHVDTYGYAWLYDAKGNYLKKAGRWHEISGVTQIGQKTFAAS